MLQDRVFGCLAASQIGSAMGAPVEGWDWRRIESEYGVLDHFLSYEHYGNGWQREPGTTEDGIERQRVFLRAIRRAGGRIRPEDVAEVWREEVDPDEAKWCMEPFDRRLIGLARAGVPATRLGTFSPYTNLVSLARSCHPIGLINALDPEQAWKDVHHVGLVLQAPAGIGLEWAGLVAAVIAEACRPGAEFEDALEAGLSFVGPDIRREVERALDVAADASDPLAMREEFEKHYGGHGIRYAASHANEIVSKAMAVLSATGGSPREAVITAVNFGRDTDCLAAVAGGIAGALSGRADLPDQWIERLDEATRANPHTCLKLTLQEMADIVVDGLEAERRKATERAEALDEALD
ncbi:MAG: ADP-ribosylglycohydrolase family protein [Candidatus Brocadiia bacterium]